MDKQYSIQFFTKFVEAMQKFCRDYIEFEQAVELSGYLSLEIDNYKKERYILSEMVHNTGDVISESYCVKAFKTMKRLPQKSETILRDSGNIRAAGVASSRDVTIDLRHSPEPRSPHRSVPQSSLRHRTANSYRSVSGFSQSTSHRHMSGQQSSPSMSPSNKRTHLAFAAGSPNQVEKQSNVLNSLYEPQSSGQNNQQLLEIQPRQSVQISSSQSDSVIGVNDNSESTNYTTSQDNEQISEEHAKGQKRSIPVSEEAPHAKKDKTDGDLDSLISAATSIVPVSEADVNSLKTIYDSENKQTSNDSVPNDSPVGSMLSESIRLPLPGNIHIKEEVDDVVLLDSPDNLGDNSDLAQLEVSFGVAGQAWNAEMKASTSQQPKFSQGNVSETYQQEESGSMDFAGKSDLIGRITESIQNSPDNQELGIQSAPEKWHTTVTEQGQMKIEMFEEGDDKYEPNASDGSIPNISIFGRRARRDDMVQTTTRPLSSPRAVDEKEENTLVCPFESCRKIFLTKYKRTMYADHLNIHTGDKPHKCFNCGRAFGNRYKNKEHEKICSGWMVIQCEVCNKKFTDPSCLKRHKNQHINKTFQCVCGRVFKNIDSYHRHKRQKHH